MKNYKYYASMNCFVADTGSGAVRNNEASIFEADWTIAWEKSATDLARMKHAVALAGEIYFSAGARSVILPGYEHMIATDMNDLKDKLDSIGFGMRGMFTLHCSGLHPQGSARMGIDPAKSVVNPHGETHDVKGLFVADASLFPSHVMVSPEETVYALASYIAEHITQNKAQYFFA
jgi:choline dehydrogenase-like flavoprotein